MPELPEVETIRQDLRQAVLSLQFSDIQIYENKSVRPKRQLFIKKLKDSKIIEIDRVGKLLIFKLTKLTPFNKGGKGDLKSPTIEYYLLIHLKMTGQLLFRAKDKVIVGGHSEKADEVKLNSGLKAMCLPNKHTRIQFVFSDGSILYFNDIRKFGYAQIATIEELNKIKQNYGLDTIGHEITPENIKKVLGKRTTSIKAALLNQQLFAGIGNIYADEILFEIGVKPSRLASKLTKKEMDTLANAIKKILIKAIKNRGTTFNNFLDSQGNKGNFTKLLKVYGRGGQPCVKCGKLLVKTRVAQRGTVYCPHCQK